MTKAPTGQWDDADPPTFAGYDRQGDDDDHHALRSELI